MAAGDAGSTGSTGSTGSPLRPIDPPLSPLRPIDPDTSVMQARAEYYARVLGHKVAVFVNEQLRDMILRRHPESMEKSVYVRFPISKMIPAEKQFDEAITLKEKAFLTYGMIAKHAKSEMAEASPKIRFSRKCYSEDGDWCVSHYDFYAKWGEEGHEGGMGA